MVQKAFNNKHGQWLGIISGRFLPARKMHVSTEQDVDMMATSGVPSKKPVQSVREKITVELNTERDPMLGDLGRRWKPDSVVFVNRKYKVLVHDATVFTLGGWQATDGTQLWSLKVKGLTYELRKR